MWRISDHTALDTDVASAVSHSSMTYQIDQTLIRMHLTKNRDGKTLSINIDTSPSWEKPKKEKSNEVCLHA